MANVLAGGMREFNALVYPEKSASTVSFLKNELSNFSNTLTESGKAFFADSAEFLDRWVGSEALRLGRLAVKKVTGLFKPDVIKPVWEIGDMQTIGSKMQRFIMAEPTIRQMYFDQRLDGWSDTYHDYEPGRIGHDHYDYRRVMDGIVVEAPETAEPETSEWVCTSYLDDILEGDRELNHDEQIDIRITWDNVLAIIKAGEFDPTSIFNSRL